METVLLMIREQLPSAFQRTVFWSFSRLRLGIFANRPVRTRMPGGVGAGGEIPPATRLADPFILMVFRWFQFR